MLPLDGLPGGDQDGGRDGGSGADAGDGDAGPRVDAGPRMDGGPPGVDAGPPEDAGRDAQMPRPDAGPPRNDAGPPLPDAGPPLVDAGPFDCDVIHSGTPGYLGCRQDAASCELYFDPPFGGTRSCDQICGSVGQTCRAAYDETNDSGGRCNRRSMQPCDLQMFDGICVCDR